MASKKLLTRRNIVIIAVLVLVLLVAAYFGGLLGVTPLGANTATQSYCPDGSGVCGSGATGNALPGELLDQTKYIASWSPNLIGQRITFQGSVSLAPGKLVSCSMDNSHYTLVVKLPGKDAEGNTQATIYSQDAPVNHGVGSGWTAIGPSSFVDLKYPDGKTVIPDGSIVHADFSVHCAPVLGFGGGWYLESSDEANLVSGIGIVNWQAGQYQTGQTARACWNVGYITDPQQGRGWSIYVVSGASGATVVPSTTITQLSGCIDYVVKDSDFSASKDTNELTVFLKNELFTKSFDVSTTITPTLAQQAPTCGIDGVSPSSPQQGQNVTVSFHCSPAGSSPTVAIKEIKVYYGYGGIDNSVILPPTATQYSFTAGESGYVRVEVIAYTVGNVPSSTQKVDVQIDQQPAASYCGPGNVACAATGGIPLWVYFAVAAAVLILIAFFNPGDYIPLLMRIVLVLIAVVLIFVGLILSGVLHF